MLGQEALSRMGAWKRAMVSGDQRCRKEGRSYEAKCCPLLAFVFSHLPCFICNSCLILLPCFAPFCLLKGSRKFSCRQLLPCHCHSQPFLKLLLQCARLYWWGMKSRGGRATNSTVPWQLLAEIQENAWQMCEVAAGCWWASQGSFMPCGCLSRYGLTWMDTDFLHFCCSERQGQLLSPVNTSCCRKIALSVAWGKMWLRVLPF